MSRKTFSVKTKARAVEDWFEKQVGPAYDALKADPSRAVPIDRVYARLAAKFPSFEEECRRQSQLIAQSENDAELDALLDESMQDIKGWKA